MSFDDLLTALFVVIFVVQTIAKLRGKDEPKATNDQDIDWQDVFKAPPIALPEPGPYTLDPEQPPEIASPQERPRERAHRHNDGELERVKMVAEARAPKTAAEIRALKKQLHQKNVAANRLKTAQPTTAYGLTAANLRSGALGSPDALRQAMVLQEVLAPPLALRHGTRRHR